MPDLKKYACFPAHIASRTALGPVESFRASCPCATFYLGLLLSSYMILYPNKLTNDALWKF